MSDTEVNDKAFAIEKAKTGRAACKKCKEKCPVNEIRLAKLVTNPFGSGKLKQWYHVSCLLQSFKTQRATTKTINSIDDIDGWENLADLDKENILEKLESLSGFKAFTSSAINSQATTENTQKTELKANNDLIIDKYYQYTSKDNLFSEFQNICNNLADESSYLGKTAILNNFFQKGTNKKRFEGKLSQWIQLLLPTANKRIYNLQSKQIIKLFSRVFGIGQADMLTHLEQGDVSETIRFFFEKSKKLKPCIKSAISLDDVDDFLNKLSKLTKEEDQIELLQTFCKLCTSNDLRMIVRFIKHDLRINSGAKHILAALHTDAYGMYQSSQDLQSVVAHYGDKIGENKFDLVGIKKKNDLIGIQLMSPISPMLAEACKSVEKAIEKCPNGMYSEIKYDGERIQLHKSSADFKFFSRNLKPVLPHKTQRLQEFISQAFPNANDLILDGEILMVDTNTGEQLPFGTLGKHKKNEFQTAEVCLFIFDCIYYNGKDLTKKTMEERRSILEQNINPVKNHVQLSEYHLIKHEKELGVMIAKVLKLGLEGLVLKNVNGIYEPGKRHWLKIKKDYLFDGKMADTADLVVLGAWYGSGKKGGILSIYLMGCLDHRTNLWKTVTKVHTGFDDKTMDIIHDKLMALMVRGDSENPPDWMVCKKALIPDMIAKYPEKMPVWEITGAEFSKSDHHTADGISIRFPRITKQRENKSYKESTNLEELNNLYEASKQCTNLDMLANIINANGSYDDQNDAKIEIKTKINHHFVMNTNSETTKKPLKIEPVTDKSYAPSVSDYSAASNSPLKKIGEDSKSPPTDDVEIRKYKKIADHQSPTNGIDSDPKKRKIDTVNVNEKTYSQKHKLKEIFDDTTDDEDDLYERENNKRRSTVSVSPELLVKEKLYTDVPLTSPIKFANDSKNRGKIKNSDMDIFDGIVLYVSRQLRDVLIEELRYFILWCGIIELNDIKKCTHILHKSATMVDDWQFVRSKYSTHSRHVQYKWLFDSIKARQLLSVKNYPVIFSNK